PAAPARPRTRGETPPPRASLDGRAARRSVAIDRYRSPARSRGAAGPAAGRRTPGWAAPPAAAPATGADRRPAAPGSPRPAPARSAAAAVAPHGQPPPGAATRTRTRGR